MLDGLEIYRALSHAAPVTDSEKEDLFKRVQKDHQDSTPDEIQELQRTAVENYYTRRMFIIFIASLEFFKNSVTRNCAQF